MAKLRGGSCTTATSDEADTVIYRAEYLLQNNGFGKYSLTKNNCEDFCLYCKTGLRIIGAHGMKSSGQVAAAVNYTLYGAAPAAGIVVSSIILAPPITIAVLTAATPMAVGYRIFKRLKADIGSRNDVEKVPVEVLADKMRAQGFM
ncbi:hypothetical protein L2E82_45905 [Cichorium intybus]|uniref:Uncharacterized protein n=1 Tax=Cichorium intybus TaxID=13427 RepID=A0ACB8ZUA8_CICIN|nr:hypothetical protein L2E82_45905 [Cichorium intybus]